MDEPRGGQDLLRLNQGATVEWASGPGYADGWKGDQQRQCEEPTASHDARLAQLPLHRGRAVPSSCLYHSRCALGSGSLPAIFLQAVRGSAVRRVGQNPH